MLGLLALVGFFAIAAGVSGLPEYAAGFKQFGNNFAVPALFLHIYDWALLAGWAAGIVSGTAMFVAADLAPTYTVALAGFNFPGYAALYAVVVNLVLTVVLTPLFDIASGSHVDDTTAAEYDAPART
jgi:SSS family solute:Na+ symporter